MSMKFLLTLGFSAAVLALPAYAVAMPDAIDPETPASTVWPTTVPTNQVLVVTLAHPGKRYSCELGSLTPEALTCVGKHGGKPAVYKTADVEALITPRFHEHAAFWALIPMAIGGAIMYGAVLLNPISEAAAVTVGIVAAITVVSGLVAAFSNDADTPDKLLYLAPDHKLSVALRQ